MKNIELESSEVLLVMLANTRTTSAQAGGHNKAFWNGHKFNNYKAELLRRGIKIPADKELFKTGIFNGTGTY